MLFDSFLLLVGERSDTKLKGVSFFFYLQNSFVKLRELLFVVVFFFVKFFGLGSHQIWQTRFFLADALNLILLFTNLLLKVCVFTLKFS